MGSIVHRDCPGGHASGSSPHRGCPGRHVSGSVSTNGVQADRFSAPSITDGVQGDTLPVSTPHHGFTTTPFGSQHLFEGPLCHVMGPQRQTVGLQSLFEDPQHHTMGSSAVFRGSPSYLQPSNSLKVSWHRQPLPQHKVQLCHSSPHHKVNLRQPPPHH